VRITHRSLFVVLALLIAAPVTAQATDHRRGHDRHHYKGRDHDRGRHDYRRHDGRRHDYRRHDHRRHDYRGYRRSYRHDYVKIVPRGAVVIPFGGHRYHYHRSRGYFYRPIASSFVVVAPPIGIVVPVLPASYATVVVRGVSYYRCDDAYYVWSDRDRGYRVVNAPEEVSYSEPAGPAPEEIFAYPRQGQNSERQASDRYACHSWAVDQTGFDPTLPLGGVDESQALGARADYQRAVEACLDARGYSVR